ncbi:MAG: MFS transporter [Candidatus Kapaibacterium sp.]
MASEAINRRDLEQFRLGKVSLVGFSHFMHDVYPAFLAPLIPLLIDKLGFSYSLAGVLIFCLRAPSLLNPVIGGLADKFDMRYALIFAPAFTAVMMSLGPLAPGFGWLCVILLMAGMSAAIYHVPSPVMIRHLSGSRIGTGMSIFMAGGELARTVGPIVIIAAVELLGFEGSYPVMTLGLITAIALYFAIRRVDPGGMVSGRGAIRNLKGAWQKNRRMFLLILGIMSGRGFLMAALTLFLPAFMIERGSDLWIAGIALSALELAGVGGALGSGFFADKFGKKRVIIYMIILTPALMLLFLVTSGALSFVMLIFTGLALFAITPIILAMVQSRENEFPASANSIFMTLNFAVTSALALLFGALGDVVSLEFAYYFSAAAGLIAIPFAIMLPGNSED